jgi:hypothetical protein
MSRISSLMGCLTWIGAWDLSSHRGCLCDEVFIDHLIIQWRASDGQAWTITVVEKAWHRQVVSHMCGQGARSRTWERPGETSPHLLLPWYTMLR